MILFNYQKIFLNILYAIKLVLNSFYPQNNEFKSGKLRVKNETYKIKFFLPIFTIDYYLLR